MSQAITHALTQPQVALAALEALDTCPVRDAVEALVELLARPHSAPLATAALERLDRYDHPLVVGALREALDSRLSSVRLMAVEALSRRLVREVRKDLARLVRQDPSWPVRRAALRALAALPQPLPELMLAAEDPHWRVRHALVRLLEIASDNSARDAILSHLAGLPSHPRTMGVRDFLLARWSGTWEVPRPHWERPAWSWWDDDPAVLVRQFTALDETALKANLSALPALLVHEEERVRRLAPQLLRRHGSPADLAACLPCKEDPRTGASLALEQLLEGIDLDRREATARLVLHDPMAGPATLAWALDQVGVAFPFEEEKTCLLEFFQTVRSYPLIVRAALARLAGRCQAQGLVFAHFLEDPDTSVQAAALTACLEGASLAPNETQIAKLLTADDFRVRALAARLAPAQFRMLAARDPDSRVRLAVASTCPQLATDPHPLVRAAALTEDRARALVLDPALETSWHVLACAARRCRVPLARLEPATPWNPARPVTPRWPVLTPRPVPPPNARILGRGKISVAPLGISGHYGLPVEGFAQAVEAGVNLYFWEPSYQSLTQFATRLPGSLRSGLHFLAGTFEATPENIRRDVEQALRKLHLEQLRIFLLFWVRSWARITDEIRKLLDDLGQEGKVAEVGLSTHDRTLAFEALASGWNPVMVRHSAAHRGAEAEVFPRAVSQGVGLIGFNSLCYGRLLQSREGRPAPTAADCYRFSLAQPGVATVMSAPATLEQLRENLTVLEMPELSGAAREVLEELGAAIYREEKAFQHAVRSR